MTQAAHAPFRFNPLHSIVLMFALTQGLGLLAGILLIEGAKVTPEVQYLSVAPMGDANDPLNAVAFLAYIVAGAVGALLVIRFLKTRWAFRILEFMVVSGSVSVLLFAYLQGLGRMDFYSAMGLSTALGFGFALAKFFLSQLKNAAAILSSAGVGAIFGFSVGFWPALLFVLGLSLYDYIAVFKTRHMLTLAKSLGEKSMSFTITADNSGHAEARAPPAAKADEMMRPSPMRAAPMAKESGTPHAASAHAASRLDSFKPVKTPEALKAEHGIERLDLGSGDLAIPAMLAVSAYTVAGVPGALAVAAGSTVSIFYLLKFVVEKRVALPALPPICMGALGALLLAKLLGF